MTIYAITLLILFSFSYLEISDISSKRKLVMLLVSGLILVAQIGLRWEVGTDWTPYKSHFEQEHTWESVLLNSLIGFEPGYGVLVWIVRSISDSYTVFLIIHAITFYTLSIKSISRLSYYPLITLLLFYAITIGLTGSNRQLLALAICLYSLNYVIEGKLKSFAICILIASFFHTSAIIFSIYYVLNRDFNKKIIFSILMVSIAFGYSPLPSYLFNNMPGISGGILAYKADYYSNIYDTEAKLSALGLIRRISVFIIGLHFYHLLKKDVPNFAIFFNGYLVSLSLYFMFSNSLLILVNRGSLYFTVMEAFIISSIPVAFKDHSAKKFSLFVIFIYSIAAFYQSINAYPDLFIPYQGIFINSGYYRSLY